MINRSGPELLDRLLQLRRHQRDGKRSPHKPLLVLLALGELANTGSSALVWSQVESRLAHLIAEFGPPSRTGATQRAAYPFTRLRADHVWSLSKDVPMDLIGPLADGEVVDASTRGSRKRWQILLHCTLWHAAWWTPSFRRPWPETFLPQSD